MLIRAVIADDEVLARQKLRKLLSQVPDVEVIGEAASASEALSLVHSSRPDLLFLDIRMPGMSGLEYARGLAQSGDAQSPQVVFTTAYNCYAVEAFDVQAVDYLLKPFTAERLLAAVQRVREQLSMAGNGNGAAKQGTNDAYTTRIVFKSRGRILFLPVSDIRWIGAEENYVRICTEKESHLLRETMQSIEQRLDPRWFLRVHRSAIVNLRYVKEVRAESRGDFAVHLVNGLKVAMSRTYHSKISELLRGGDQGGFRSRGTLLLA